MPVPQPLPAATFATCLPAALCLPFMPLSLCLPCHHTYPFSHTFCLPLVCVLCEHLVVAACVSPALYLFITMYAFPYICMLYLVYNSFFNSDNFGMHGTFQWHFAFWYFEDRTGHAFSVGWMEGQDQFQQQHPTAYLPPPHTPYHALTPPTTTYPPPPPPTYYPSLPTYKFPYIPYAFVPSCGARPAHCCYAVNVYCVPPAARFCFPCVA